MRQLSRPRRTGVRVYGLGASKTGTHTLSEMFDSRVRCGHEADANRLIPRILHKAETGDGAPLNRVLRLRDALRGLKIDSSSVNAYLIDELLALFPDSRFILTVRAPGLWLRSMVDHSVLHDPTEAWKRFRTWRFGPRSGHPPEEAALAAAGLYPISAYLGYWQQSVGAALDKVPPAQLLILRTEEIGPRAAEIAAFCGLEPGPAPKTTHAYATRVRSGLLDGLEDSYLEGLLERETGPLARRALPGWSAKADIARLRAPKPAKAPA
ncbi:sulfotransferase [Poseidonocella sedimentorum]|nr:sulfotransferase [Poseidonocella sedimentorum]